MGVGGYVPAAQVALIDQVIGVFEFFSVGCGTHVDGIVTVGGEVWMHWGDVLAADPFWMVFAVAAQFIIAQGFGTLERHEKKGDSYSQDCSRKGVRCQRGEFGWHGDVWMERSPNTAG